MSDVRVNDCRTFHQAIRDLQVDPTTCVLSGIPGTDENQIRIANASCVKVASLCPPLL